MLKKRGLMGIILLTCLLSLVFAGGWPALAKTEPSYRSVKVLGTEGTASVERDEETFTAYEGMLVKGADILTTGEKSRADLKLDDDKYMVVEENSRVEFELKGNPRKGAIGIHLLDGAVYNNIENPLSEEDSYEIYSSDYVMAVRGTKFRVEVTVDEKTNTRIIRLTVLEGTVHIEGSAQDGTGFKVGAGYEVIISIPLDSSGNADPSKSVRIKAGLINYGSLPDYVREEEESTESSYNYRNEPVSQDTSDSSDTSNRTEEPERPEVPESPVIPESPEVPETTIPEPTTPEPTETPETTTPESTTPEVPETTTPESTTPEVPETTTPEPTTPEPTETPEVPEPVPME